MDCTLITKQLDDGTYLHTCRACGREHRSPAPKCALICRSPERAHFAEGCRHRGGLVRTELCKSCSGQVKVKVFACEKFGECTLKKSVGVKVCEGCSEWSRPLIERCYVINLKRRPDRLQAFHQRLPADWPFPKPEVFSAIDGKAVKAPGWWHQGNASWGCYRSHLVILEKCLSEGVESVLILEDDATFSGGFSPLARAYFDDLPNDWEMAYLGGQHLKGITRKVNGSVVVPRNVNRTHAYAIRGRAFIQRLYDHLLDHAYWKPRHHIDHHYGRLHESGKCKVYAPTVWLAGQAAGRSDINRKEHEERFWNGQSRTTQASDRQSAARQATKDFVLCFPDAMPFCGTLLGMIRDGDLIPWDHDVDFAIGFDLGSFSGDEFRAVGPFARTRTYHHNGVESEWSFRHKNGTRVDLFRLMPAEDGKLELAAWPDEFPKTTTVIRRFAAEDCAPGATRNFWGTEFQMPANPAACLAACYGSNWQTPDPKYNPHAPLNTVP